MEVDAFHQLNPGSQTGHLQLCLVITTFRTKIESQVILEACTFHWITGPSHYFLLSCTLDHRRRQWHLTPVLLPGKSHGWRSLVGCSPRGREESDMTKWLHFHFSFSCIGEGNGNPLQCSCLENPRDGGAWWAAIYGVAQSRTRLTWLSSSSSNPRPSQIHITCFAHKLLRDALSLIWREKIDFV